MASTRKIDRLMRELINTTEERGDMLQALCRAALRPAVIMGGHKSRPLLQQRIKEAIDAGDFDMAAARLAYLCWMVEKGHDPPAGFDPPVCLKPE